jgi:hypothetical protein
MGLDESAGRGWHQLNHVPWCFRSCVSRHTILPRSYACCANHIVTQLCPNLLLPHAAAAAAAAAGTTLLCFSRPLQAPAAAVAKSLDASGETVACWPFECIFTSMSSAAAAVAQGRGPSGSRSCQEPRRKRGASTMQRLLEDCSLCSCTGCCNAKTVQRQLSPLQVPTAAVAKSSSVHS